MALYFSHYLIQLITGIFEAADEIMAKVQHTFQVKMDFKIINSSKKRSTHSVDTGLVSVISTGSLLHLTRCQSPASDLLPPCGRDGEVQQYITCFPNDALCATVTLELKRGG